MFTLFTSSLLFVTVVRGASIAGRDLTERQDDGITALPKAQIQPYKPFTHFASAAYCQPSNTLAWNCGADCKANSDFIPVASGGDGGAVQFWFVGYSPSLDSVIVSHQGTDPSKMESISTDANIELVPFDSTLFPGINSAVEVHNGFATEQAKTAKTILAAVKKTISAHSTKNVAVVGHSLGAAIALLDSVYLPLHITGVNFRMIGYGLPRVGNQYFANYVDKNLNVVHINNREDPIPTVPGLYLNFHHPSGEIHIRDNGNWVTCPGKMEVTNVGQDNPSTKCIVGDVPNIGVGNLTDHTGPYNEIKMGAGC
ncbi:Alpha/Beta hydrolase protein [Cyathus striatus]|nr:Alpha/Beta hydrolase protein [Cyathus striatus]